MTFRSDAPWAVPYVVPVAPTVVPQYEMYGWAQGYVLQGCISFSTCLMMIGLPWYGIEVISFLSTDNSSLISCRSFSIGLSVSLKKIVLASSLLITPLLMRLSTWSTVGKSFSLH